ncbi:MAG: hypothetical protein U5M53_00620 [Rhodoferax sp.]|nr:hypothetical protein [Rhodoferax sp.]
MTPTHVFFVPSVFFLGFFVGGVFSRAIGRTQSSNHHDVDKAKTLKAVSAIALGISLVAAISTFAATHMVPLLGGVKALGSALGGQRIFDQHASFTSAEVYARLDAFGPVGREMYQHFTYSADVLFPLTLLAFLFLLAKFVGERTSLGAIIRKAMTAVPIVWFSTDMLENAMVYKLLTQYPKENVFIGDVLGTVTIIKFALLLSSIAIPAIASVLFRYRKIG